MTTTCEEYLANFMPLNQRMTLDEIKRDVAPKWAESTLIEALRKLRKEKVVIRSDSIVSGDDVQYWRKVEVQAEIR